jgi:hypothetical protein
MSLIVLHGALWLGHWPLILARPPANHWLGNVIQRIRIVLYCVRPLITGRPGMIQIRERNPTAAARQHRCCRHDRKQPPVATDRYVQHRERVVRRIADSSAIVEGRQK